MSFGDIIEREIDSYYHENIGGIFSKRTITKLVVYPTRIETTAFPIYEGTVQKESKTYYFEFSEIKKIYEDTVSGKEGIVVEYISNSIVGGTQKVIILGIPDREKWIDLIESAKDKLIEKKRKEDEEKREKELEAKLQSEKIESDALNFYKSCYSFHIPENTPIYELLRAKNKIAAIYVGNDHSLNFLKIDGYGKEESNATIPYNKIHYYEKAGNIHYVSDIHGNYSSYGGSFTGGDFSKLATVGGGLLFGMMGMTAGALLTYKPAEYKGAQTFFHIDSDVKKIDERSVILNYYSDIKKQYIDIEMPADIYNFLQTHLPNKKYGIVLELEKKLALQQELQLSEKTIERLEEKSVAESAQNDSMEIFKIKVDKLKMMKDADLLTDEEFRAEMDKLIKML